MYIVIEKVFGDPISRCRVYGPFEYKVDADGWKISRKAEVKAAPISKMYLKRSWTVKPINDPS